MKKILLVDNDPTLATLLAEILAASGDYDVEATNDPQYAFRRIQDVTFDLVIADWQMPSLNGDTLFRRIRTGSCNHGQCQAAQPRLLLMSDKAAEARMRPLLDFIGDTSYLHKPFDAGTLVNKVEEVLFGKPRSLADEITQGLDYLEMHTSEWSHTHAYA